ncbi:DUF2956 domain-containing protein [Colwellia ponticola]|uniref:DUF2956 domain-containing protein n=1 Tax=Colwellia ponticola TaxID=2304625 RepID=A0A8H2JJK9_9GAMM|nr:DUF2956 domain-containing protein [Colwellia ponticola]TMM43104.1 DUF2956 domain-containing protein [Colwellia ponticola]
MNSNVSKEVQAQAIKVAKATQKKGQTKEQTKLIAQGIEKGIAQYKKQQSIKSRARDKERKQELKQKQKTTEVCIEGSSTKESAKLPWLLLVLSWVAFISYVLSGMSA